MSASREKKQRQGSSAANERALAAQKQADATRRKTIQYTIIGAVIAVLVIALLVWNSGFFQQRMPAVTVKGTSYSAAEVSYSYYNSYSYRYITQGPLAQYGLYNTSRSPKDQTYSTNSETGEVITYHDYFLQAAKDELVLVTALYDAAVRDGHTEAEVKDAVQADIQDFKDAASAYGYSYKQFLQLNYGNLMTPSAYEKMVARYALAGKYQSDYQDSLTYGESDYQAYYNEHKDNMDTFEYSYLYFPVAAVPTKDADGNDITMTEDEKTAAQEANKAEAREKAEAAEKALKDGSKTAAALIEEYELTSSSAEASTVGSSVSSIYSEWLKDAARKAGDVTLVENGTSGFYVVVFHGRELDDAVASNVRHILVKAEISDGATAPTDEQRSAAHAKAEEILNQWKSGAATSESFAALAEEKSDDGRNEDGSLRTAGGLYEEILPSSNYVTPFKDWIFSEGDRKSGDTGLVDINGSADGAGYYGTHIMYFVGGIEGDYEWQRNVRSTLISEATQTWQEGLTEGYTAADASALPYVGG